MQYDTLSLPRKEVLTCHTISVISVELLNKVELLLDDAINVVLNIAISTPQRDRNVLSAEKVFSISHEDKQMIEITGEVDYKEFSQMQPPGLILPNQKDSRYIPVFDYRW